MNSYIALTKTFIKSLSMSKPKDKRRKLILKTLSFLVIFFIFIPCALLTTLFVYNSTKTLVGVGLDTFGLELIFYVISLFSIFFGIFVILNELYFSNDLEHLLPWPLKPFQIVLAKFSATYIGENIMQIIFIIASLVGFFLAKSLGFLNIILAITGAIFLMVLPMVYCSIISIIIMRFTRFIKNKDLVQKVTMFIIFIILLALLGIVISLQNFNLESFVNNITNLSKRDLSIFNIIFINVPLFIEAINSGNILSFIYYLLVNVIAIIITAIVANLWYYKGLVNLSINRSSMSTKDANSLAEESKQERATYSYFLKEMRILYRTPTFYTHCIISNFLWPIFFIAIVKVLSPTTNASYIRGNYLINPHIRLFMLVFIIGISAFVTALNSISSNSISREGKHFQFMKSIPLSYKSQLNVKASIGIFMAILGVMIFFIPTCLFLRVPLLDIIIYVILGILSSTFTSYLGLYIDSVQPKLVWDDELSVLRENYNVFFSMAIIIAFITVFCLGGYFFLRNKNLSFTVLVLIFLALETICNLLIYVISKKNLIKNIIVQEEM